MRTLANRDLHGPERLFTEHRKRIHPENWAWIGRKELEGILSGIPRAFEHSLRCVSYRYASTGRDTAHVYFTRSKVILQRNKL